MDPDIQPVELNRSDQISQSHADEFAGLRSDPISRARALEDSFANAGLLGLPEPAELLRNFERTRESLIEAETNLIVVERQALKAREEEIAAICVRLHEEETRTLSQVGGFDKRYEELKSQEGEVLVARASVSSQLAARRTLYPARIAERTANAEAQRRRHIIEGLREEHELLVQSVQTAGTTSPHGAAAIRDATSTLQDARTAQAQADDLVLRLERVGLSRTVAGAALWVGASALLASGWLSATRLAAGFLPASGIAGIDAGTAVGAALGNAAEALGPLGVLVTAAAVASGVAVLIVVLMTTTDRFLAHIDPTWRTGPGAKRVTSGHLPAGLAGGLGKRLSRGDLLSRTARAPFVAATVIASAPLLALLAFSEALRHSLSSPAFWLDIFTLLAGVCAASTLCAGVLTAMAISASKHSTDKAADAVTPLWIPACISGGSIVAAPLLVVMGLASSMTALALIANALAATSLATGLYLRGLCRAGDVRRSETRRAEAALDRAVENASGPFTAKRIAERLASKTDLTTGEEQLDAGPGSIDFIRPTRRFFRTPQDNDPLDKATIEEYSAADALFEPELLAQLFHHRATLEQLRAAIEDVRTTRAELRHSVARVHAELREVHQAAKTEREEFVRRIRLHSERILRWREEQATIDLNVKSAYVMGRSLRTQSDTRILEDTHVALSA
jgi:hypothetical protein